MSSNKLRQFHKNIKKYVTEKHLSLCRARSLCPAETAAAASGCVVRNSTTFKFKVWIESLPQVKTFECFRVSFSSEGKMERVIGRQLSYRCRT